MKKFQINRRTFLRSATSGVTTVVGLPLLECMFSTSEAYADAPGAYPRFFSFYVPNGIIAEKWFPSGGSKTNFSLKGTALQEFEKRGLKNEISIYRGMRNCCDPRHEGRKGNPHMPAISAFLTGKAIRNDEVRKHVESIDQQLANALPRTKVHSLQLAGNAELDKPNNSRYNNALKNALSWDKNGNILPLKSELRTEFDRLYSGNNNVGGVDYGKELSVLDDVRQQRDKIVQKVSAQDRARLEEYFDSLRDLELALESEIADSGSLCAKPDLGNIPNPRNGQRTNSMGNHAKVAAKIAANAFACGLTHAITYAAGGEAAGCQYRDINVNAHFHNTISHNRNGRKSQWIKIDEWHGRHCAIFMDEFKKTRHGEGDLLDGTAILFGSGMGNGDAHNYQNIGLMVGGRFGNWKHGRLHDLKDQSHARLIDTLRQEMGLGKRYGHRSVPIS